MEAAAAILRQARERAQLSQAELAGRLGVSQAAIARLERPGSNPRVNTVAGVLAATGHRLTLAAERLEQSVDETLVARQLDMTPAERIAWFEATYEDARALALAGARARGEVA